MTLQEFINNKNIKKLFKKKFEEIECTNAIFTVQIHPSIKYLFTENKVFARDFAPSDDGRDAMRDIIGMLWGANVQVIKDTPYFAKFIGEYGQIGTLGKIKKPKKIPKPFARFDNLEF